VLRRNLAAGRHLCVGLDPVVARLPQGLAGSDSERVVAFNTSIVQATAAVAGAYKPNSAFFEALGPNGHDVLAQTISAIRRHAPDAAVVLDAKRGDIGSSNDGYLRSVLEFGADCVTVHPYLGRTALAPFLQQADLVVFVLARTSNPGAGELQDLICDGQPLYRHVARAVAESWNELGNCGVVAGATYPQELELLRADCGPDLPFLIPGVGAQGGSAQAVVDCHHRFESSAFLVNSSRAILYASSGADFAEAAHQEAVRFDSQLRDG